MKEELNYRRVYPASVHFVAIRVQCSALDRFAPHLQAVRSGLMRLYPVRPFRAPVTPGRTAPGSPGTTRFTIRLIQGLNGTRPPAQGTNCQAVPAEGPTEHPRLRAGTTATSASEPRPPAEHPRLRGDHCGSASGSVVYVGTPPPARGPRTSRRRRWLCRRNTPACAGTTREPRLPRSRRPEHPHLRGDHAALQAPGCQRIGTPPPARGPPKGEFQRSSKSRNTPACAGTTASKPLPPSVAEEDPRLRGDHNRIAATAAVIVGTPPPARGPRRYAPRSMSRRRNTPACAGTTRG